MCIATDELGPRARTGTHDSINPAIWVHQCTQCTPPHQLCICLRHPTRYWRRCCRVVDKECISASTSSQTICHLCDLQCYAFIMCVAAMHYFSIASSSQCGTPLLTPLSALMQCLKACNLSCITLLALEPLIKVGEYWSTLTDIHAISLRTDSLRFFLNGCVPSSSW